MLYVVIVEWCGEWLFVVIVFGCLLVVMYVVFVLLFVDIDEYLFVGFL